MIINITGTLPFQLLILPSCFSTRDLYYRQRKNSNRLCRGSEVLERYGKIRYNNVTVEINFCNAENTLRKLDVIITDKSNASSRVTSWR